MKMKLSFMFVMTCLAVTRADVHIPQHGIIHQIRNRVAGRNPYIFLTVPNVRSQSVLQDFEVIEEEDDENRKTLVNEDFDNDDEEFDNEDEDMTEDVNDHGDEIDDDQILFDEEVGANNFIEKDEDDENNNEHDYDELENIMDLNLKLRKPHSQIKNAKATQMMVSRQPSGAIVLSDKDIEIKAQSVIDKKTGKAALLLPRAVLDSIPNGSVVALIRRAAVGDEEERANRVIVRRRRKGGRRNKKRCAKGNKRNRVVSSGSNKRRGNKNNRLNNHRRISLQL